CFRLRSFIGSSRRLRLPASHPTCRTNSCGGSTGSLPGQPTRFVTASPCWCAIGTTFPERNGGLGIPSVTTHLHNGHTPSESDGFPCDFFAWGSFYDQHYPNALAGILPMHPLYRRHPRGVEHAMISRI